MRSTTRWPRSCSCRRCTRVRRCCPSSRPRCRRARLGVIRGLRLRRSVRRGMQSLIERFRDRLPVSRRRRSSRSARARRRSCPRRGSAGLGVEICSSGRARTRAGASRTEDDGRDLEGARERGRCGDLRLDGQHGRVGGRLCGPGRAPRGRAAAGGRGDAAKGAGPRARGARARGAAASTRRSLRARARRAGTHVLVNSLNPTGSRARRPRRSRSWRSSGRAGRPRPALRGGGNTHSLRPRLRRVGTGCPGSSRRGRRPAARSPRRSGSRTRCTRQSRRRRRLGRRSCP